MDFVDTALGRYHFQLPRDEDIESNLPLKRISSSPGARVTLSRNEFLQSHRSRVQEQIAVLHLRPSPEPVARRASDRTEFKVLLFSGMASTIDLSSRRVRVRPENKAPSILRHYSKSRRLFRLALVSGAVDSRTMSSGLRRMIEGCSSCASLRRSASAPVLPICRSG
jgi:hypothetical protein